MEINSETSSILDREKKFHDQWASSINLDKVMVNEFFEASTSPENRIIIKKWAISKVKGY